LDPIRQVRTLVTEMPTLVRMMDGIHSQYLVPVANILKAMLPDIVPMWNISNVAAVLVSLYACVNSVFNFRSRLVELRKGTYFKSRYHGRLHQSSAEFKAAPSMRMIGMQLGSVLFGYVVTFILSFFVCLLLDSLLRVFTHLNRYH
jgi:hypothetical protein